MIGNVDVTMDEMLEALAKQMRELEWNERIIIVRSFGLIENPVPLETLASYFATNTETIRRTRSRAIAKLRRGMQHLMSVEEVDCEQ